MTNDPIADMLNRIYTNTLVGKRAVSFPATKVTEAVTEVLQSEGYLSSFAKNSKKNRSFIEAEINYFVERNKSGAGNGVEKPVMKGFSRVSKSSCRIYVGVRDIKTNKDLLVTRVLSTPKGVLTDRKAIEEGVGGELLFEIW